MTPSLHCEVCGSAISPGPLGDVCPVCLLREGHTDSPDFVLDALPGQTTSDFLDRGCLPRAFGHYDLIEAIAHGGMGIVYRAHHRALNREVALKLLLAGSFASPDFVQRFQREAAAAASLRHPNIVGVYEVGEVDGQPFLAMEYVAGQTLAELVRTEPLPARAAARYLQIVAEAVQHAHDHGLLHRDIKPSNVIVDLNDEPRVTDFGLAKRMDGSTDLTVTGQMLGSPNYLSPEAALGRESQLSPASDIYSLGATFYHLLTGRPPLLAGSLAETIVRIREETAVASRLLNPSVPADLDTIVQKCLEKDPAHRYPSARELAEDLARWQRGEPIRARPAGPAERAWKWARRHPAPAALIGTVAVALVVLVTTSLWFNFRLTNARNESERNRQLSETNRVAAEASLIRMQVLTGSRLASEGDPFAAGLWFAEALRQEAKAGTHEQAELPHRRRLAGAWASAPRLVAAYAGGGHFDSPRFSPDGQYLLLAGAPPRMMDLRTGSKAPWFNHPDSKARGLSLSASGTRIAEIHEEPAQPSRILTLAGNPVTNVTLIPLPAGLDWVSLFSPDERWLVTGGERIRFWDTATGKERPSPLPPEVSAKWMEFSPDGRRLLVRAFADSSLRVWNLDSGTPATPAIPSDHYNAPPAFSPDGDAVLSSRREGALELEIRKLSEPTRPLRVSVVSPIYAQAFHPSGRWIATGHWDGRVRLWSADTLEPLGTPLAIPDGVVTVAFSPDGTRLAASGYGREVRIWSFPEGRFVTPPLRLGLVATHVLFSPDGRYLLGLGRAELIRTWDLHVPPPPTLPEPEHRLIQFDVSSKGAIAGTDRDGQGHLWEPVGATGSGKFQHRTLQTWPYAGRIYVGFDPAGNRIATFGTNAQVQLWSVATGKVLHEISHGHKPVTAVCFSPDGRHLVTVGEDDLVRRWDAGRGTEIGPPLPHGAMVRDAAFSADSRRVATAGVDGLVRLWDLATGQPLGKPMRHDSEVARIRFSPDGSRLLASVGDDSATAFYAQVWDATTGEPIGARMAHDDGVGDARFFPDGTRLFTAGEDGFCRVWDAATGKPRSLWMRCDRRITRIDLSPDGRTLATVDESARLRLWDADSGEPLTTPTPSGSVLAVRFLDAHRFVYAQLPGPIRLWELPMESAPRDELLDLARLSAGFEIDIAGGLSFLPPPEQEALFHRLQARDPARFRITSFAPEWHRQELDRALRTTNTFAEKFHRRALERQVSQ